MAVKGSAMVANPRSPLDLRRRFSTMEECRDFLFGLRFPDGWLCSCGGQTFWWRSGTKIRCRTCSRDRSVLAGTIFQKTRTPLPVWFKAAWGIATASGGISALQLQRDLGLGSYETAWTMLHRYRRAMTSSNHLLLAGTVEVSDTLIGGVARRAKPDDARGVGVLVAIASERAPAGGGRVRLAVVPELGAATLSAFVVEAIAQGSSVATNDEAGYQGLGALGFHHQASGEAAATAALHTVRQSVDLLQSWLIATHQGRAEAKHLQSYLDEFAFRFNQAMPLNDGLAFRGLLEGAVAHDPVTYHDVTLGT